MRFDGPRFDSGWRCLLNGLVVGSLFEQGHWWAGLFILALGLLALGGMLVQDSNEADAVTVTTIDAINAATTTITLSRAVSLEVGTELRVLNRRKKA